MRNAFKIEDFDTKSTLSWALQKCARSKKKKLFCSRMARNGKLELLKFLRVQGCPWDRSTCSEAAKNGHLECLKYLHEMDVLGMDLLVIMLPEMVISVFAIRARKRMSLE